MVDLTDAFSNSPDNISLELTGITVKYFSILIKILHPLSYYCMEIFEYASPEDVVTMPTRRCGHKAHPKTWSQGPPEDVVTRPTRRRGHKAHPKTWSQGSPEDVVTRPTRRLGHKAHP